MILVKLKIIFFSYFKEKFKGFLGATLSNPSSRLKFLDSDQRDFMSSRFTIDEFRNAIWSCGSDRSPRLDGFLFRFVKKFWDLLKEDIYNYVNEFFDSCVMVSF